VSKTTRGAVETCLVAETVIEDDDAVIIMDCDLEFKSRDFTDNIKALLNVNHTKCGGVLLSFKSNLPKYSYAETDKNGFVVRTAEKEVISDNALCGAYFFTSGRRFKEIAHELLNEAEFSKPEFYVSLLYNYLLRDDEYVQLTPIDEYYSYGTPEELKQYTA
jgi:dTDP-glucose pyrophosphorylase